VKLYIACVEAFTKLESQSSTLHACVKALTTYYIHKHQYIVQELMKC